MWESRRDFQRVWEGWEAGFLAFHAFHTLSFPWPAFRPGNAGFTAISISAMGRTRKQAFVVIVVDECFGDYSLIETWSGSVRNGRYGDERCLSLRLSNKPPRDSLSSARRAPSMA
jgi:hypothetical protein